MSKHINTDEFIKQLKQFCYSKDQIIEKINGMSSDKVVNLVRCKDCKHLFEINPNTLYVCDRIDYGMDGDPSYLSPENDFCSRGERKETE